MESVLPVLNPSACLETNLPLCSFCKEATAKYTCPKCGLRYCCKNCYQSEAHLECSETFYKEWCELSLLEKEIDAGNKGKIIDALKRLENYDQKPDSPDENLEDLDSDDDADLSVRIKGLDLNVDTDKIWEALTLEEREDFQEILASGKFQSILGEFVPWWTYHDTTLIHTAAHDGPNVVEVPVLETNCRPKAEADDLNTEQLTSCASPVFERESPKVVSFENEIGDFELASDKISKNDKFTVKRPNVVPKIRPLHTLTSKRPSPDVLYSVFNVIYSYAYVVRIYHGNHNDQSDEAVEQIYGISGVLNNSFNSYPSSVAAAEDCVVRCKGDLVNDEDFHFQVWIDVRHIFQGSKSRASNADYLLSVLSDIRHMLRSIQQPKKELTFAVKKVDYLLSWCCDIYHGDTMMPKLFSDIGIK